MASANSALVSVTDVHPLVGLFIFIWKSKYPVKTLLKPCCQNTRTPVNFLHRESLLVDQQTKNGIHEN